MDLRVSGAQVSLVTFTGSTHCGPSWEAKTYSGISWIFFELYRAPTSFFREKPFLKKYPITSNKHFALIGIEEITSFGFPRISHKDTFV